MRNNLYKRTRILLENKTLGSYMKYLTKLIFFSTLSLIFSNVLSKDITIEKFTTDDIYKIKNIHSVDLSDSFPFEHLFQIHVFIFLVSNLSPCCFCKLLLLNFCLSFYLQQLGMCLLLHGISELLLFRFFLSL